MDREASNVERWDLSRFGIVWSEPAARLVIEKNDLHARVLLAALGDFVVSDRLVRALTTDHHSSGFDPLGYQ